MISPKMEEAINQQINAEMYSAYLYYAMANYFESVSLKGFANWMRVQAQEEMIHAVKFTTFLNDRGGRVKFKVIAEPPFEWKSPIDAFETVLIHENKVTGLINDLVNLSIQEKDHAANTFLQWFVTEQVEEEANDKEIIDQLKLIGDDKSGLFMINRELALRPSPITINLAPAAPAA